VILYSHKVTAMMSISNPMR